MNMVLRNVSVARNNCNVSYSSSTSEDAMLSCNSSSGISSEVVKVTDPEAFVEFVSAGESLSSFSDHSNDSYDDTVDERRKKKLNKNPNGMCNMAWRQTGIGASGEEIIGKLNQLLFDILKEARVGNYGLIAATLDYVGIKYKLLNARRYNSMSIAVYTYEW
ncbi:hypothetical protein SELMODRAFT_404135 [Selaginella moellendorffii]|uniref:Uncharacterized protein n=1 Tax=Selaginella moellendorffii TaxID=88036 RepID=D8QUD8_SELML|nr:hypothetical protein SELMODRAFT_404135 [Selaginella moellendorffii]